MGKRQGRLSDAERAQRRERERERLERAVEELLTSDGWRRWLKARAVLHGYSLIISGGHAKSATSLACRVGNMSSTRASRMGGDASTTLAAAARRVGCPGFTADRSSCHGWAGSRSFLGSRMRS